MTFWQIQTIQQKRIGTAAGNRGIISPKCCCGPFLLLLTTLLLVGCHERQTEIPATDPVAQHPYFPLKIGQVRTYQLDSITFDHAGAGGVHRDSSSTFLREMIVDTLRDNTGQLVFAIERWERQSDTASWALKNVWTAARTATEAVRTEDNLRFLRLVFPLDTRTTWDGNRWLDPNQTLTVAGETLRPFANWHYAVDSLDVPIQAGSFMFDSVLIVTEVDETGPFERRLSRVKYARNIGLVWREQWLLDSQYCNQNPPPADCDTKPWAEKAEKGFILRQTILDFN